MEQGELKDIEIAQQQARFKALADQLDRLCKEAVYGISRTDFANANGVTHQAITKMLNTNGAQSDLGKDYIPSIAELNPDKFAETVLFFLCDLCGREHPPKKRELTPEERLKGLEQALGDMDLAGHPKLKKYL